MLSQELETQLNYLLALVNDHLALLPQSSRVAVQNTVQPILENIVFTLKSQEEELSVLRQNEVPKVMQKD